MITNLWYKAQRYGKLSEESRKALEAITQQRSIAKNELFVAEGASTKTVAFVVEGIFSQCYSSPEGEVVIKKFFPEGSFMASLSALVSRSPSLFTIKALEKSTILEYSFYSFKELAAKYIDISQLYINYLETHWILEKEPLEISYRCDDASTRYQNFLKTYPGLGTRIKQHEIAAYLGITPTQLSRIRAEIAF